MSEPSRDPAVHAREAWQSYRYLADNSIDVVLEADPQTVMRWVSDSVREVLGWDPDTLIGMRASDIVHPDDLPAVIEMAGQINEGERIRAQRCRVRMASGEYLPMQLRGRAATDELGAVVGHVITLQDTAERDAAIRALATLSAGTRAVSSAHDEDELLQGACEAMVEVGGYPLAWYAERIDDDRRSVIPRASAGLVIDFPVDSGLSWGDDPLGQGPTGVALRTGTTQIRHDFDQAARMAPWMDVARFADLRSSIALPVVVDDVVHGALITYASEANAFNVVAQELFENLAAEVARGLQRLDAQRLLDKQSQRLSDVFTSYFDPFVLLEPVRDEAGDIVDLRYIAVSDAACEYNRLPREQMIGATITQLFPAQKDDGSLPGYLRVIETGNPLVIDDFEYFHEPRQELVRLDIRAFKSGDGVAITFRNVTERHAARAAMEASEARYRLLAENSSDIICQVTDDATILWVSESVEAAGGWRPEELIGRQVDLIHPDDQVMALEALGSAARGLTVDGELRLRRKDGTWRWMHFLVHQVSSAPTPVNVIALRDVDDEVRARAALDHATGHDPLTGLPARARMVDRIERALEALPDGRHVVGVLDVGIDSLSAVNDAFTHAAGDLVITAVAARVVEATGTPELVGRGTGSEFLVIVPDLLTGAEAADLAERVRLAVRGPVEFGEHSIQPTVSIGIAIGGRGANADQLVREAAMAMSHAKTEGRDRYAFADRQLADQAVRRLDVESRIRAGIARDEFLPFFQPIVTLPSGDLSGYEALVRLVRDDGTIATPDRFMPVAERTPLIAEIDMMVLRKSLAVLSRLPAPLTMSINVSSSTLANAGYADEVEDLLAATSADPRRLHLEVTETALLASNSRIRDAMQQVAELGARWYVDDFGTGYSSISHLRDLPITGLKLDLSFTAGIRENDVTSTRLAQALAGLANGLHLDTVAEGVEDEIEAGVLAAQGWRHGQGWLFGKPAPDPRP